MSINEILNSDLLNSIIEQEDKDLAEANWSRKEINEMAKFIIKKRK